jgi:hypothetical protein
VEMDWQHYNYWRGGTLLHSGIRSRTVSTKKIRINYEG